MDKINEKIIALLKKNSRISWQKIGKELYITGQAVSARVQKMEDEGVISGYTIKQDNIERHFITVFMENNNFSQFEKFIKNQECIEEAYKVTGEGCYQLVFTSMGNSKLENFLNDLLVCGRYKVLSSVRCVK